MATPPALALATGVGQDPARAMPSFLAILAIVLPVYLLMVGGAALRRAGLLTGEADASLMKLLINVLFPALLLDKVLGNPALKEPGNLLLAPLVGAGTILGGYALCLLVARLLPVDVRRTFAFTAGTYNYGYIPLPLALSLFGDGTAGVLMLHNVAVEAVIWTVGVALVGGGQGRGWRALLNVPLITIVLALVLNALEARPHIPAPLMGAATMLGQCAIPLALLLAGAVTMDHLQRDLLRSLRVPMLAALVRLGVLPALFILLAIVLPAPVELRRVIVLQAAMPSAIFPIIITRQFGGDVPTALRVILSTSVLALITAPLWIAWGLRLIAGQGM